MALATKIILLTLLAYRFYFELPEDIILREHYTTCSVILILLLILYHFGKRRRKFKPLKISKVTQMPEKRFVDYVYAYFLSKGYTVEAIPAKGNFGADLILYKWGRKTVVRIKKSQKSVGLSAVQEVAGAVGYHNAHKAIVISNGKFTRAAIRLAKVNHIVLWDKTILQKQKITKGG